MKAGHREKFHWNNWEELTRLFRNAIYEAGARQKKEKGNFSQHLLDILEELPGLKKNLRENPMMGYQVLHTMSCGKETLAQFIRETIS
ncbi:MAG: hypothetical protein NTZ49_05860 [Candidatus Parcubacteria bacterium]|nr:hypothetical protein [Candidatus Parcubacteria bacterium]